MSKVVLKKISIDDKTNRKIYEMLNSFPKEENGFINPGYGITWEDFPRFIDKNIDCITNPDIERGRVPQTLYWLFDGDIPVGMSKMRHYLNEGLLKRGGHIGYGVLKEYRNKGYAKSILRETIKEIRNIGVKMILITCDVKNIASRKVIEANNGRLEREEDNECYYWIRE